MTEKAKTFKGSRRVSSGPSGGRRIGSAPHGDVLHAPPGVFHTTVTERASFRTCRRQWYLENIERLEPTGSPAWPLLYGTVMHDALDTYYRTGRDLDATYATFEQSWEIEHHRLGRELGPMYEGGPVDEWWAHHEKGLQTLKYYDRHDRADKFFTKVVDVGVGFDAWRENISVEERHFIDILSPDGLPVGLLSGRIDLVVRRKDGIWIVDHKNYASAPSWRALEVDDQLTGYCFIWWRMTGKLPRGALYNVLLKDPPKPPRILVSGKLSTDKAQRTTYDLFLDSVLELGLEKSEYAEFLDYLKEDRWKRFFPRSENVGRNEAQVRNFGEHLAQEYLDMEAALHDPAKRYPNATQATCRMCSMVPLCNAMEDGSDADAIKASMYYVKEPRHSIPAGAAERIRKEQDGT